MTCTIPGCRRNAVADHLLCDSCLDALVDRVFGPKPVPGRTGFLPLPLTKAMRLAVRGGMIEASRKEDPRG